MTLWPANRTYSSEPLAKTIVAPIFLLVFSIAAFFLFLNPFTMPQVADMFGMSEEATMTIERVENETRTALTRSWNCDHWVAYGMVDGREIYTRACNSQVAPPNTGETLTILLAPNGDEAYLLARGEPVTALTILLSTLVALLASYGVVISLRLFYIGYSSNWKK